METIEQLEIKAGLQVLKPIDEVFEAIVDPDKMKNYFISKGSGIMKEGETLIWKFPEMDIEFPVKVGPIKKSTYISFIGVTHLMVGRPLLRSTCNRWKMK